MEPQDYLNKMTTNDHANNLADLLENLETVAVHAALLDKDLFYAIDDQITGVRQKLIVELARDGRLDGAEYCDEAGDVIGVVEAVGVMPDILIDVTNTVGVMPDDIAEQYFRVPGSEAYGRLALVELTRARTIDKAA